MVKASFLLARRPPLVCPTIASMASSRPCRGTLPRRSVLSVHVLVSVCFSSSSFLGFSCFTTASPVPSPSSQSFSPFGVPAPFAETSSWRPGFPSSYLCFLPSLPHSSGLRSPLFSSGHLAASSGGRCSAGRCTRARGTPGYSCLSSFSSANLVSLFPTSSVHSPSGPSARRRPAHRFAVTPVSSSFASLSRREPTAVGSARRQFLLFQGKSSDLKESYDTHKLRKRTHPGTIMIRSTLFRLLSAAKPAPTLVETTGKGPVALEIEQKLTQAFQPTKLKVVDETSLHAGHEATQGLRSSETHFRVYIASPQFKDLSLVQRHRKIYALLQKEIDEGIHALSIHAEASSDS